MSDESKPRDVSDIESMVIPDGTKFVIIDLDREKERVQVEFTLNGKVMRAWVLASHFERMAAN